MKIVRSIPRDQPILFAPDRNLGRYLVEKTGREMVLWQGTCIVHETFSEQQADRAHHAHPEAEVIAHPECEAAVLRMASFVGSTSALLKHATESASTRLHRRDRGRHHPPDAQSGARQDVHPGAAQCRTAPCNECPFMRLNTLEKLYLACATCSPEITMPEELRLAALRPIERMLALS